MGEEGLVNSNHIAVVGIRIGGETNKKDIPRGGNREEE